MSKAFSDETSPRFLRGTRSEVPTFLPGTFRLTPSGIAFLALSAFVLRLTELAKTGHTGGGASEVEDLFCFLASLALAKDSFCALDIPRLPMMPKPGD
jgi:hypothetical protein